MLRTELEVLTGKLIRGDITPIVYELIKDSPYVMDIFEHSAVVIKEEDTGDSQESPSRHADNNGRSGPSFESWLRDSVQSFPV